MPWPPWVTASADGANASIDAITDSAMAAVRLRVIARKRT